MGFDQKNMELKEQGVEVDELKDLFPTLDVYTVLACVLF